MKFSLKIKLTIAIFIISGFFCQSQENRIDKGYHIKIGDTVPDIHFNFTNGDSLWISELRGKVVVLQFTASWCSVCRKEMPHLEKEVWKKNKDKDFILIGVDYDEPLETVLKFQKKMKTTYPIALDPGGKIFSVFAYKNSGVTRNVVIDKNGQIAFLTRLYDKKEFDAMKDKIDELLKDCN